MSLYGETGPPSGYSAPRYESKDAKRRCQKCGAVDHWTFECKRKPEKATTKASGARLSRSQMLKYGVKRERVEFVPEPTQREQAEADFKEIEKTLVAEVNDSKDAKKMTSDEHKREQGAPSHKKEKIEELFDVTVKEETSDTE
ncbi:hypothetical protein STCU_12224 [Strigomonas culicis]|uniref:Uncharacterized protein n=1 Tax=Strigomonas culicis TaxID=28005 RepID=S9TE42_9TRYP|nr:hypothetical protein STCU_12224 [Strigomonas culicis]|eukprot:EPY15229.1 hypothetical protein STCU_12224 [Strigomonas culicis]